MSLPLCHFDNDQHDLFGVNGQGELFAPTPARAYKPNLDKVRSRLNAILAEARAAKAMSGDFDEHSLYRAAFPSLLRHLPDEEAARYAREFEAELVRLEAA